MDNLQNDFKKIHNFFHPKHIAFIGASESSTFGSMLYLTAFQNSRWADTFYPINPKKEKILDWKCYSSVLDVPFPIDLAYVSLKINHIPKVVKECVEKKVKWVVIFASGFSETGDSEGEKTERKLLEIIEGSTTRIVGPNCLGPFNTETRLTFSTRWPLGNPGGTIGFMSQSGGHATQLIEIGVKRDIRLRYGVSFGNQIDLNCVDFLKYFRHEPSIKIVAAYLESTGSANGNELFIELQKTTMKKPVILWKGGHTSDGARAAFSHTGAIASNNKIWSSMAKQSGTILVRDNEEWWNLIKTFESLFPKYIPKGRNVVIVTPGGGSSVNMTDILASHNLMVPKLTEDSQNKLAKLIPDVNTSTKNPIDLGAIGFSVDVFAACVNICIDDPNIDMVVLPLWSFQISSRLLARLFKIQEGTTKPIIYCFPSIADSIDTAKKFNSLKKMLNRRRALYFLSLRDAAQSISSFCDYYEYLQSRNGEILKL